MQILSHSGEAKLKTWANREMPSSLAQFCGSRCWRPWQEDALHCEVFCPMFPFPSAVAADMLALQHLAVGSWAAAGWEALSGADPPFLGWCEAMEGWQLFHE